MDEDRDYEVGYAKPPRAFQFRKGRSGNPRGRPRQDPGIATVFRKISKQKVRTNGPNGPQWMTKLEASLTQLVNKAASGDLKATKLLMEMASRFPELIADPGGVRGIIVEFVNPDG